MNPQHIENITDTNRIANAPYNFVELPEDIVKAEPLPEYNRYHENTEHQIDGNTIKINRHTGRIECTLITKSIFYTRSGLSPENFAQYSEPPKFITKEEKVKWEKERKAILVSFFSSTLDNLPVIPGSSIRGMLRNLVEIISFSKIDRVTNNKLFYRSLGDPALKDIYPSNFVESLGEVQHPPYSKATCYRTKVHAGFLRKRGNCYIIQECGYGRINFDSCDPKISGISRLSHSHLYQSEKQGRIPNWIYQNKTIYIDIDEQEQDNFFEKKQKLERDGQGKFKRNGEPDWRHGDFYLRYRKVHSASFTPAPELQKGTLVITGDMKHKHLEFVFLDQKLKEYSVSEEMIRRFQDDYQVTKWQADAFPKDKPSRDCREQNGYLRDGEPVFFLLNDDGETVHFLGRAQMFRLPYENSPLDFVPPQLRNRSCTDIAEAIFGYVNGEPPREKICASRVFITDGILEKKHEDKVQSCFSKDPQQILLSSPKPTTFQHYLVQPKETQANQHNLKHYASKKPTEAEPGETVIRGHKLYWHKPCKIETPPENADTQTSLIKPIDPNIEFTFRIYFENLSDVELGALLWILDKAEKPEYCLSLGMGKPLGMGAVKVKIDKLCLDNRKTRYTKLFADNNQWESGETSGITAQRQECINFFEKYVLQRIHKNDNPKQATSLDELPRIQMLLTMLQCDSLQDSKNADYMTIESQKYQKRHVLPTPLQVARQAFIKKVELPKKKLSSSNLENPNSTKAWERPKK